MSESNNTLSGFEADIKWNETSEALKEILITFSSYIQNDQYVYKKCSDEFIVILKKTDKTNTNESRKDVVDHRYASFRGDLFFVERIFYSNDPSIESTRASSLYDQNFHYTVGQMVVIYDFDTNLDTISGKGIHYFKDIRGAYYCNVTDTAIVLPENYNGIWKSYNTNGQIIYLCKFVDGNKRFTETHWNNDGKIIHQTNFGRTNYTRKYSIVINNQNWCKYKYPDNKNNVTETYWYENGQIKYSLNYSNGVIDGNENQWYKNGQIKYNCDYNNGLKYGLETEWYENGLFKSQCNYVKGLKNGSEFTWYKNGRLMYKNIYLNGQLKNHYDYIHECPKNNYKITMYFTNNHMKCQYDYSNGQLVYLCNYVNEKKVGTEIKFYKNDKKHFNDENQIEYQRDYHDGTMNYTETQWYENGNVFSKGIYTNDTKAGMWSYYDKNGLLLLEKDYDKIAVVQNE